MQTDGQMDRQKNGIEEANCVFRDFANAPKNNYSNFEKKKKAA